LLHHPNIITLLRACGPDEKARTHLCAPGLNLEWFPHDDGAAQRAVRTA
jgi:hypothetical protein